MIFFLFMQSVFGGVVMICPIYITSNIKLKNIRPYVATCLENYKVPLLALKANAIIISIIQQQNSHKYLSAI